MCNVCERLCPPVDRSRTRLHARSQCCRCIRNDVFSRESGFWGRRLWILLFSGVKHSFTGARSIKTTLWFARAASFLESWSCFYFLCLFCPSPPAQRGMRSLLSQLSLTCCGVVSWSLCRAPWDTRHPLEEVMLQQVDVRHGLAALNLKWCVAAYQSILASGHSILTWFIFNSKKPLNQVIVTCLHMPLLFLWVLVLYFFTSLLPCLTSFWDMPRKFWINLLFPWEENHY